MKLKEIEEYCQENEIVINLYDNPTYEKAIVGLSYDDRVIYDFDLMIECAKEFFDIDDIEAIEYLEVNVLRGLSYYSDGPIILYTKGRE
jgi:hypothetical protein